ncbi:MBL fold metallo-hydrolase [Streptomyces sp. NPDC026672]|uniref:MBL fold metallo-hydrolase n=1 Tax=unclassified Streptomyces TaxID=2593676 RepID=UPI0033F44250
MHSNDMGKLATQAALRTLTRGDVRLTYVVDGAMAFYPASFLPSVPAGHWEHGSSELDAAGRVPMSAGGLLVERDGRALLIDAGLGPIAGENPMGAADSGSLLESLARAGKGPEDIDTVAFTHLHADHTGWAFSPDAQGAGRPTFPRARYVLARQEWAPYGRGETVPGAPPNASLFATLSNQLVLMDDGEEIFPGVYGLVTPGHTAGHTSYIIHTGEDRVVVFGDAFHIPAQLAHPEWGSQPDLIGAAVPTARRTILSELETPDTLGFAFHFGDQPFGRVERDGDDMPVWRPVLSTVLAPSPRTLT